MKIERNGNTLICVEVDKLTDGDDRFFQACYIHGLWIEDEESETRFKLRYCENVVRLEECIRLVLRYAEKFGCTVDKAVFVLAHSLQSECETEKARAIKAREVEMARLRWARRKETGCEYCTRCKKLGDADFFCGYSGDRLDCRMDLYHYDPVTRQTIAFYEIGEPNEHCKDYFEEKIIRRN